MANKLIDPGEIYIVGQYELGTSTPTSYYKIGMAQNDSTTVGRVKDHQTGNPNRIFIEAIFPCQAVYLVERLMHQKWKDERVSQEWFEFDAADLAQAKLDPMPELLHKGRTIVCSKIPREQINKRVLHLLCQASAHKTSMALPTAIFLVDLLVLGSSRIFV